MGSTSADTAGESASTDTAGSSSRTGDCPAIEGHAWTDQETTSLESIGSQNGLEIFAAEYPLPGPTTGLWSQWGQGVSLGDGSHISAVGDHLGVNGNSWFYRYEPEDRTLTRLFDVQSVVPSDSDSWGYGKIHAQMAVDDCGSVWAATYWGSRRDIEYDDIYQGDRLLQLDVANRQVVDHGLLAGQRGIPAMTLSPEGHIVAVAVDADTDTAILATFDTATGSALDDVDDPRQVGFRSLGPSPDGSVVYSIGDRELALLDPEDQTTDDLAISMPGDWLRAATSLNPDNTWYGVTQDEPALFEVGPDGVANEIGSVDGYTTSLAMTETGDRVYWMPGAHGDAWEQGATVLSYSSETGEISEVVSLATLFEQELGLLAGGTYSVVFDRGTLILGVNASDPDEDEDDSGFGTVVLVVIEGL